MEQVDARTSKHNGELPNFVYHCLLLLVTPDRTCTYYSSPDIPKESS